jgi:hypothetical protein
VGRWRSRTAEDEKCRKGPAGPGHAEAVDTSLQHCEIEVGVESGRGRFGRRSDYKVAVDIPDRCFACLSAFCEGMEAVKLDKSSAREEDTGCRNNQKSIKPCTARTRWAMYLAGLPHDEDMDDSTTRPSTFHLRARIASVCAKIAWQI